MEKKSSLLSVIIGAIFLMASSSIGPGFLTQTAVFTAKFRSNFAFAILMSVFINVAVQLNVWRMIAVTKSRGQEIGDKVVPGLGKLVTLFIVLTGFVFNIANVGGAGLGMHTMFDIDVVTGSLISAAFAIGVFLWKESGKAMDKVSQVMGLSMLFLTGWVCIQSRPPVGEAVVRAFAPEYVVPLIFPMISLIGGTVGGYITFSGAHRLLDAGITGPENLPKVSKAATMGVVLTGIMRIFLFLGVLGVVTAGNSLDMANPAASVFQIVGGKIGYRYFGVVLWCAAVTSIIGCAYTSISFLHSYFDIVRKYPERFIIGFITITSLFFAILGKPVVLLTIMPAFGSLALPLTLGTMLIASKRKDIVGDYKHPPILFWLGVVALVITLSSAWISLKGIAAIWNA